MLESLFIAVCKLGFDILSSFSVSFIFLVFDWVMKQFLRKYRESQFDWFGKRGISWYIVVVIKGNSGEMELMIFVYVFESVIV